MENLADISQTQVPPNEQTTINSIFHVY